MSAKLQDGLSRRAFLGAAALPLFGAAAPKRIAVITTIYRYLSHGQHMADRFLVGYPHNGAWHMPNMKVVSLYVDQKPEGDLSEARAKEFGFRVYPTIAETLRCGGDKLAVDAVLIIAEHGDYPVNSIGQKEYPRYEFFRDCVAVFEKDGRAVPVYNDKHLSYSFEKARKMVADSKRLGFPMLAGSSLPVTWRLPDVELPLGCEIEDALMVGENGDDDAMDFHALEAMQCMLERRKGGETGVRSVQWIAGDAVWKAPWSKELLVAALSRSDTPLGLTVKDGRTQDLVGSGELYKLVKKPVAYMIEYRDGLRATMLNLRGALQDFNFAARVKGHGTISTQFLLTPVPNVTYSACLMHKVEEMFATGRAPYPVERTLLTSGMLEACHKSGGDGDQKLATPHLTVTYRAPQASQYCRA
ncbi:MAG TPA: hypothetical protein VHD76_18215 [Bryobacteraceae bacterium]|jgi:hypothetical protein|nr:hypothetical protein [Bryobacteraceae bacterium]